MAYSLALGALAFMIGLVLGPPALFLLRRFNIAKVIRVEGPTTHAVKAGTPTMGGIIIFLTVFIVTVPLNLVERLSILLPLGMITGCGVLGAGDDGPNLRSRVFG